VRVKYKAFVLQQLDNSVGLTRPTPSVPFLPSSPFIVQGLLEKHKDYVERAKDFNRKKKTISSLRQKALFKNPDEFYFAMTKSKTKGKKRGGREGGKGGGRRMLSD